MSLRTAYYFSSRPFAANRTWRLSTSQYTRTNWFIVYFVVVDKINIFYRMMLPLPFFRYLRRKVLIFGVCSSFLIRYTQPRMFGSTCECMGYTNYRKSQSTNELEDQNLKFESLLSVLLPRVIHQYWWIAYSKHDLSTLCRLFTAIYVLNQHSRKTSIHYGHWQHTLR